MKRDTTFFARLALALFTILAVFPALAQGAPSLDEAVAYTAKYQFGQDRSPLEVVVDAVQQAGNDAAARQAIAAPLIAVLNQGATPDGARFICRQLGRLGTAEASPALAKLLGNEETVAHAILALEVIPGDEAGNALRAALDTLTGAHRLDAIRALGLRGEAASVAPLAALLGGGDAEAAEAAAYALAHLDDTGRDALAKALPSATGATRNAILDGLVGAQDLAGAENPSHVRAAALLAKVKADPASSAPLLVAAFGESDPDVVRTAAMAMRAVPGEQATQTFAGLLEGASPGQQVLLLAALRDRADVSAERAVLALLKASEDETVKLAAIDALSAVGGAQSIAALVDLAAKSGKLRSGARDSLKTVGTTAEDKALIELAEKGSEAQRSEAVRALAVRRSEECIPLFLKMAALPDAGVHGDVLEALEEMCEAPQLGDLIALLEKAVDKAHSLKIEKAIVATSQRIEDPAHRADAILAALGKATKTKPALLRALAPLGTDDALEAVRQAMADKDPAVRLAAVAALAAWPGTAPLADLEGIVTGDRTDEEKAAAFKGYVEILGEAKDRSTEDQFAGYQTALAIARDDSEKARALAGLGAVSSIEALKLAESYRAEAGVAASATLAMIRIAGGISGAYEDDVRALVQPLTAADTPEEIRTQAEATIKAIDAFGDHVTAWKYAGPYARKGESGSTLFDHAFPPEQGAADVVWRVLPTLPFAPSPEVLHLDSILGGNECVVYLRAYVHSDKAQETVFSFGSNDAAKLWCNGELLFALNAPRPMTPDEDKATLKLNAGANEVLFAVYQHRGAWEAVARLTAPGGGALEGVRVSIER